MPSRRAKPSSIEVDCIFCCTGYKVDFSWLNAKIEWDPRSWYKHCFPPRYGESLCFLGYARGHQGGIPQMAEILARYAALVFTQRRQLPQNYASLAQKEGDIETRYFKYSPTLRALVDYPSFMMSIADLIGCSPKPPSLFSPTACIQFWYYPLWPVWFRKDGLGARPELFERTMEKFPLIRHGPSRAQLNATFIFAFAVIIQIPLDALFKLVSLCGFAFLPTAHNDHAWKYATRRSIFSGYRAKLDYQSSFSAIFALVYAYWNCVCQ